MNITESSVMVLRLILLLHVILPCLGLPYFLFSINTVLMFSCPILNDSDVAQILTSCMSGNTDSPLFTEPVPFAPISVKGMEMTPKTIIT